MKKNTIIRYSISGTGFLIFILFLNSCKTLRQDYNRPQEISSVTDSLFREEYLGKDTAGIARMSWKELFKDEKLQHLIQKGIDNNNDLKAAVASIKAAQATYDQSKKELLPTLSAGFDAQRQKSVSTVNGGSSVTANTFSLSGEASWEADIWGKLSSASRANLDLLLQSQAYQKEVQTQLVASIAEYYYTLMAYDRQLKIAEETILNREEDVKTTEALFNFKNGTSTDVEQSKANVQSAKLTKIALEQSIEETENALCTLIGIPSQKIERNAIIDAPIVDTLDAGLPVQLLANRPDVQQAEYQLRYYTETLNVARAYFYPSLGITISGGWSNTEFSKLFNPSSLVWSLLGSVTQPIFQQGENKLRLETAKANIEEYSAKFKQAVLDGAQEVNDNMVKYKKGIELETERKIQIQQLEKAVEDSKFMLSRSSSINYTDVLTAEQNLLSAQLSAVDDKLQQAQGIIGVYRSLGGGWE